MFKNRAKLVAEYKCTKCGHIWEGFPGPQGGPDGACFKCGSLYAVWTNFLKLYKSSDN